MQATEGPATLPAPIEAPDRQEDRGLAISR